MKAPTKLSRPKKIAFAAVVLALALAAVEIGLCLLGPAPAPQKAYIKTARGAGNCYSAAAGLDLPLNLTKPKDRAALAKIFKVGYSRVPVEQPPDMDLSALVSRAPSCIVYDKKLRKDGFHPKRKRRVALIGDSFTFGEGVKDEDTLGHILGRRFPGANFLTLARPGAEVRDVNIMSIQAIEDMKVRDLIYFFNLNDVIVGEDLEPSLYLAGTDISQEAYRPTTLGRLADLSRILKLLRLAYQNHQASSRTIRDYLAAYDGTSNRENLRATLSLLTDMSGAAAGKGARFLLVIYPYLYRNVWGSYPFSSVHALVLAHCKKHRIRCVDGAAAFQGRSVSRYQVHPADSHPNGLANRTLVKYLVDNGWITLK